MTPHASLPAGTILPRARRLTGGVDPLALYRALSDQGRTPDTFLLESADRTRHSGERSLIGARSALRLSADRETIRVAALSPNGLAALDWVAAELPGAVRAGATVAAPVPRRAPGGAEERDRFRQPSPLDVLRRLAFGVRLVAAPNPWCHLAVGTFGYDAIDWFERLPEGRPDPLDQPLLELWIPDQLVVVDHVHQAVTAITTVWGGDGVANRYHDADRSLERLVVAVAGCATTSGDGETEHGPGSGDAGLAARSPFLLPPSLDQDDAEYQAVVRRMQRQLARGDIYQVVPSRTFTIPCPDPLGGYAVLRRRNPSPYLFYLAGEERTLLGASPETCLRVDGPSRRVTVLPIAGTAPRGRVDGRIDPDTDTRNEVTLRLDPKELAEHLMLVDLARNDVARISVPGTREVTRLLAVERYQHVMHLVSEVSGILAPDVDPIEAYAATMPMGTLVGAPKVRAAELLREVEPSRRGCYGGGVGYLRHDGTLETAIVIRSAVVAGGMARVRAGAGVVLDSDPAAEAEETRRKARAVLEAIAAAEVPVHV